MLFLFYIKKKIIGGGEGGLRAGLKQNTGKSEKLSILIEQVAAVQKNIKPLTTLKKNLLSKCASVC